MAISSFDSFYMIDKTAYIAARGAVVGLSFLASAVAVGSLLRLYVRVTAARRQCAHLLPMLLCALAYLLGAVAWAVGHYVLSRVITGGPAPAFGCDGYLALALILSMLETLPSLLIAAVGTVEAARQLRAFSWKVEVGVGVVLSAISILYVFVVNVPVFYLAYLTNVEEPCRSDGTVRIEYEDIDKKRALPAVEFLVPHVLVFLSGVLLVLARLTRSRRLASNQSAAAAAAADRDQPASSLRHDRPFPFNVLLAAVASDVCNFIYFLYQFRTPEPSEGFEIQRSLWLAGLILALLDNVLVPCCWMLDCDVRQLWCCRGNASPARPGSDVMRQEADAMMNNDEKRTGTTTKL